MLSEELLFAFDVGDRGVGDVDVGGVHDQRFVVDHLLARVDKAGGEHVVENTLVVFFRLDDSFVVEADLDINRGAVGGEDVVVEADTIEDIFAFGEIDPMEFVDGAFAVEADVEYQHLVPRVDVGVVVDAAHLQEHGERQSGDEAVEGQHLAIVGGYRFGFEVDGFGSAGGVYSALVEELDDAAHILVGAATGVDEGGVVGGVVARLEVAYDILFFGVGEETPHGVLVEAVEVAGVEFAVVGDEEFFGDGGAELAIEHLLEVGVLLVVVVEEVVEAVDKLLFRKLVDVFLERIFDKDVLVFDFGVFDRFDDVVGGHVAHDHLLDIFVLEMEEVAGVIPDEAVAIGCFAIAADAVAFFEEGPIVAFVVHGEREARDATTDNNILIHH